MLNICLHFSGHVFYTHKLMSLKIFYTSITCIFIDLQSSEVTPEEANKPLEPADVFVSYCWLNSEKAHKSKHVRTDNFCSCIFIMFFNFCFMYSFSVTKLVAQRRPMASGKLTVASVKFLCYC